MIDSTHPIFLFRPNVLANLNEKVGERGVLRVEYVLEQLTYLCMFVDTDEQVLASYFIQLIRRRPFLSGNKRTAALWLLTMVEFFPQLNLCKEAVPDTAIWIEAQTGPYELSDVVAKLFPPGEAHEPVEVAERS